MSNNYNYNNSSKVIKVAINGFGRIGRMVFRAGFDDENIEFLAINDLTDTKTLAYLLKNDSVHGKFLHEVSFDEQHLIIDGKYIRVYAERDPEALPWKDHDIDVAIESTGFFRTRELLEKHLRAGAKKVLLSAPAKSNDVKTIVVGVNEHLIIPEDTIISNASCTTNSLAPIVKVLNDNYGIEHGFMTTIHSYTGDQKLVDAPNKDLRRGRSAAINIVPTTTGAAVAVTKVIPELQGKLDGVAVRVPTPDGSLTDFVCKLKKSTTKEEINWLFNEVSKNHMKGILHYSEDPLVSSDIVGDNCSTILDAKNTKVIDGSFIKIMTWYDNEWGYSNRMIDLVKLMMKK